MNSSSSLSITQAHSIRHSESWQDPLTVLNSAPWLQSSNMKHEHLYLCKQNRKV